LDYFISTLENGFKIIIHDIPYVKTITASLWIKQGAQNEDKGNNGISHLLEHNLIDLARTKEGEVLQEKINDYGAKINAATTKEFTCYNIATMNDKERFKSSIEALFNIVTLPLSESTFEREKKIVKNEIEVLSKNQTLQNCLYALWDEHSIALPVIGKKDVIDRITFEEIEDFFKEKIVPPNTFLVIIGNFNNSLWPINIIKEYFSKWENRSDGFDDNSILVKRGPRISTKRNQDEIVYISLGFDGVNFYNPQSRVLEFIGLLLSDGINSRLYKNLRVKNKYIYSINCKSYSFAPAGAFVISSAVKKEYLIPMMENLIKEIELLRYEDVSNQEIYQTSQRYLTKLAIELDKPSSLINFIGRYYILGKIFTYYDYKDEVLNINSKKILHAANAVFNKNNLAFAATGDFDEESVIKLLSQSFS
jgi:predicted Zn-dependent peptidase